MKGSRFVINKRKLLEAGMPFGLLSDPDDVPRPSGPDLKIWDAGNEWRQIDFPFQNLPGAAAWA